MESHKLLRDYGRLTADKADKTFLDHVWSRALTVTMTFTAYRSLLPYRKRFTADAFSFTMFLKHYLNYLRFVATVVYYKSKLAYIRSRSTFHYPLKECN